MSPAAISAPPGMVLIPGGKFTFGVGAEKREVDLAPYFIDIVPVTNKDWAAFCEKANLAPPRHWADGKLPKNLEECPVVWVKPEEAEAFAREHGKELPTPAQWEKAARGTDGRKYAWGSDFDPKRVNSKEAGNGKPVPSIGLKKSASPFGCLGMGGNVQEWTSAVSGKNRVVKGGSFRQYLGAAAWQYEVDGRKPQDCVGFRCVKLIADGAAPK